MILSLILFCQFGTYVNCTLLTFVVFDVNKNNKTPQVRPWFMFECADGSTLTDYSLLLCFVVWVGFDLLYVMLKSSSCNVKYVIVYEVKSEEERETTTTTMITYSKVMKKVKVQYGLVGLYLFGRLGESRENHVFGECRARFFYRRLFC